MSNLIGNTSVFHTKLNEMFSTMEWSTSSSSSQRFFRKYIFFWCIPGKGQMRILERLGKLYREWSTTFENVKLPYNLWSGGISMILTGLESEKCFWNPRRMWNLLFLAEVKMEVTVSILHYFRLVKVLLLVFINQCLFWLIGFIFRSLETGQR